MYTGVKEGLVGGTHESTEEVVIGASAQSDVPHVIHDYFLGHLGRAVEHHVLVAPPGEVIIV